MICGKCDHDLAECSCPDLEERFDAILKIKTLHVGEEYQARIRANIEKRRVEHSQKTITE